jgi:hypothetical protein
MDTSSAIVPCLQAARPSENRLFHFGKSSHRRLTDSLFKSLNTEHVSGPIEHLDEPIGVENHSIAGRKFDLFGRRGLRALDEATEDASARLEQADGAVGDEKGWWLATAAKVIRRPSSVKRAAAMVK